MREKRDMFEYLCVIHILIRLSLFIICQYMKVQIKKKHLVLVMSNTWIVVIVGCVYEYINGYTIFYYYIVISLFVIVTI